MKKALYIFITLCACNHAIANRVSVQSAQKVAANFYQLKTGSKFAATATLNYTRQEANGNVDFYVFNFSPKGFVIVAADDNISPIIAYSTQSNFNAEANHTGVKDWMNHAATHIATALQHGTIASSTISSKWSAYAQGQKPVSARSNGVAPLVSTNWDQFPYYNQYCPYNSADSLQAITGCVATAMAQIMKYWNYPAQGTGSYGYNDIRPNFSNNYGVLNADFGATTYHWDSMPLKLTGPNNDVATLMFQCGVAVAMDYGDTNQGGSGAIVIQSQAPSWKHTAEFAYKNYFSYNPNTLQGLMESDYTTAEWTGMLINELNQGRPVQYVGLDTIVGGHTWVVDGYDENEFFHMNWGWSGLDDGYYSLGNLSVYGLNFSNQEGALIGIEPIVNISVSASVSDSLVCNGSATVINAVGAVNASYSWSPDSGLACAECATTTASPSVTTVYTVTMDSSGFTTTASITVNVRPAIHLDNATVKNVSCFGLNDGSIDLSLSGGASSFSYNWSNGANTPLISNLLAGTYFLTANDAAGCFFESSQIVTEPTSLVLSVATVNATCNKVYGSAVVNVTGGTPNFSYLWNNGSTDSVATRLTIGAYSVTVSDSHHCSAISTGQIDPAKQIQIITQATNIETGTEGAVSVAEVKQGQAPYTFAWSNGDTSQFISNLTTPGVYSVTVTDYQGCAQTATATVQMETATGIKNASDESVFSVYPNPAQNQLNLHTGNLNRETSYKVINGLGQTVLNLNVSLIQTQIDLSNLTDGVYFIQLTQNGKTYAKQFIVQK